LGLATINLARSLGLPRPIEKLLAEKKAAVVMGHGSSPKIWGFPFNIYTVGEASDYKFGTQLGFIKAHHKTTPRRNVGVALG